MYLILIQKHTQQQEVQFCYTLALKNFPEEVSEDGVKTYGETSYENQIAVLSHYLHNAGGKFSKKQKEQITTFGSLSDKVFLLSIDEMDQLSKDVLFKTSSEWWTRTVEDGTVMYVASSGWIKAKGDQVVRDKGVRPSICISLK